MDQDVKKFLEGHKLFSSLDKKSLQTLIPKFTIIHLNAEQILFNQGDPSEFVYILATGKLATLIPLKDNQTKMISAIYPGETVGELGALTNELRTFTVTATKDCILYRLSSKDFVELCHLSPNILFETLHPMINRSHSIIQKLTTPESHKNLSIIPANQEIDVRLFIEKFTEQAKKEKNLLVISEWDPDHQDKNLLQEKIENVQKTKNLSQTIIFLIQSPHSLLAELALPITDRLTILADGQFQPLIDIDLQQLIKQLQKENVLTLELILFHPPFLKRPSNTHLWLELMNFNMHYHVNITKIAHFKRLFRFILGNPIGLVLSGGGTRGFAHLGAIKALREDAIPIDFIGGCSVGAIVGATFALNESYKKAHARFIRIVKKSTGSTSWKSLTWPIISIFNAKKFTEAQIEAFKEVRIEDLWIPYFCISSNISNCTEDVHRDGILWEKTRASAAIPGFIPPMVINHQIHYDGGLFNNLPVDIMRQFLGAHAKIIAIELNNIPHDAHQYDFPPILNFKQCLLYKLGWSKNKYKFPRFMDTFFKSLLIGSSAKTKINGLAADILVNINLTKFKMLNSNLKQGEKMIELGYIETLLKIHQLKNSKAIK